MRGEEGVPRGAQPLPRGPGPPPPRGVLGGDHPEVPSPHKVETMSTDAQRLLKAPIRELRGGGRQGRVLLAAAPGTSRPPRRRSHGDRKPSRRPERSALAPRAVPDRSWLPVIPDPSWLQATVHALEYPRLSTGRPSPRPSETSPQLQPLTNMPSLPPLSVPQLGQEGRGAVTPAGQEHLLPGPAAGRMVLVEAAYCCVQRSRNRKWVSRAVKPRPPPIPIHSGRLNPKSDGFA